MSERSNESVAVMLEKLASELDEYADEINTQKQNAVKTASNVEFGSLDTRKVTGTDSFTQWLLG